MIPKQEPTYHVKQRITNSYKPEKISLVCELWWFPFWDVNQSLTLNFHLEFIVKSSNSQLAFLLPSETFDFNLTF